MEITGGLAANEETTAGGTPTAGAGRAPAAGSQRALAAGIAAGVERLVGLLRSLSPADGLSATAASTLATLERSGPRRLTALAVPGGGPRRRAGGPGAADRPGPGHAGPAPGGASRPIGGDPGPDQPAGPGGARRGAARHRSTGQRAARRHPD